MTYFAWRDDLSVGNTFIDGDHRKLIGLVNELHTAMGQGSGRELVGKVLGELIRYTKTHFQREEDYMAKIAYPALATHKTEHDKLLVQVQDLQAKFDSGAAMVSVQVSRFLRDWLTTHILKSDKALAAAIKNAGH